MKVNKDGSPIVGEILNKFEPDNISIQSSALTINISFKKGNYSFYLESFYTGKKHYLLGFKLDDLILDFEGSIPKCLNKIEQIINPKPTT